jgi:hypothetical protein
MLAAVRNVVVLGGLGPELVVNGTFDADTTGWTPFNSILASVSGQLQITATSVSSAARQTVPVVTGRTYQISNKAIAGTGIIVVRFGISAGNGSYMSLGIAGDHKAVVVATSDSMFLSLGAGNTNGLTALYDDISVREVS